MLFGTPLYWRETHRQPKFMIFDWRIVILLLLMVMHIKVWTILLVVIAIFILWWFGRKGVSPDSIIRFLRATLVGRKRTARGPGAERLAVDFGFETMADIRQAMALVEMKRVQTKAQKTGKKGGKT